MGGQYTKMCNFPGKFSDILVERLVFARKGHLSQLSYSCFNFSQSLEQCLQVALTGPFIFQAGRCT